MIYVRYVEQQNDQKIHALSTATVLGLGATVHDTTLTKLSGNTTLSTKCGRKIPADRVIVMDAPLDDGLVLCNSCQRFMRAED